MKQVGRYNNEIEQPTCNDCAKTYTSGVGGNVCNGQFKLTHQNPCAAQYPY